MPSTGIVLAPVQLTRIINGRQYMLAFCALMVSPFTTAPVSGLFYSSNMPSTCSSWWSVSLPSANVSHQYCSHYCLQSIHCDDQHCCCKYPSLKLLYSLLWPSASYSLSYISSVACCKLKNLAQKTVCQVLQ